MIDPASRTLSESDLAVLCCVACRGTLTPAEGGLSCRACGARYPYVHGFADFRGFRDSPAEVALSQEVRRRYAGSSYTDLIAFHYRWIHETEDPGASAGRVAQWNLEQVHYVRSIDRFGKWHLQGAFTECTKLGAGTPARQVALDVGCGWGRDLYAIAQEHDVVWGFDVEASALLYAEKLLEERGLSHKVRFVLATAERLPFRDATFDFVNASAVIEHVKNPENMTREAHRVLRPGGWYYFYYPNRFSLLPETHTSLWGVGFLPRPMQLWYVRKARGMRFSNTVLFSVFAMSRLVCGVFGKANYRITGVTSGTRERALASKFAALLGTSRLEMLFSWYGVVDRIPVLSQLAFFFLPIHYVTCRKDAADASSPKFQRTLVP